MLTSIVRVYHAHKSNSISSVSGYGFQQAGEIPSRSISIFFLQPVIHPVAFKLKACIMYRFDFVKRNVKNTVLVKLSLIIQRKAPKKFFFSLKHEISQIVPIHNFKSLKFTTPKIYAWFSVG